MFFSLMCILVCQLFQTNERVRHTSLFSRGCVFIVYVAALEHYFNFVSVHFASSETRRQNI